MKEDKHVLDLVESISSTEKDLQTDLLRLLRDAGKDGLMEEPLFERASAIESMRRRIRLDSALMRVWEAGKSRVVGVDDDGPIWESAE